MLKGIIETQSGIHFAYHIGSRLMWSEETWSIKSIIVFYTQYEKKWDTSECLSLCLKKLARSFTRSIYGENKIKETS